MNTANNFPHYNIAHHYVCYVNKNGRNLTEVFEGEDNALDRIEELGLTYDDTVFVFSTNDGYTKALPVGTFETECYFVIYNDGNGLTWAAFKNQEAALAKTTPAHPRIFNYGDDISGYGCDVQVI